MRAHAEVVNVECEKPVDLNEVTKAIKTFPGIQIIDDRLANRFPTPLDVTGMDDVLVGRIRHDISDTTEKSLKSNPYSLQHQMANYQLRKYRLLVWIVFHLFDNI